MSDLVLGALISGIAVLAGGALGALINHWTSKSRSIREHKIDAYASVFSNIDNHFKHREAEERNRILGKAIILAKSELQSLLMSYSEICEMYEIAMYLIKASAEAETFVPINPKWSDFEKFVRTDSDFRKAVDAIKNLMREEIGVDNDKKIDIDKTKKILKETKEKGKQADIPPLIYR